MSTILELIANASFAVRYGKPRTHATPVSIPTALLTFLFFGFIVALVAAAVSSISGSLSVMLTIAIFAGAFLLLVWRCGVSFGIQFSAGLAVIYLVFFIAGVGCALYIHSVL